MERQHILMRRTVTFGLLSLLITTTAAAASLDFVTTVEGLQPYSYAGHLSLRGAFSRIDITSGRHPLFNPATSIVTQKRGDVILVLNHADRTYFFRGTGDMSGPLSTARGFEKSKASNVSVVVEKVVGEPAEFGGRRLNHYSIRIRYDLEILVENEKLPATVEMTGSLSTLADEIQDALPWGIHFAAKSGFPEIDRAIARKLPRGLPVRTKFVITRRVGEGPTITESILTEATSLNETLAPAAVFSIPAGYKESQPRFSFGAAE